MPVFSFAAVFNRFFRLIGENAVLFILLGLIGTVLPSVALSYGLFAALHLPVGPWSERFADLTTQNVGFIAGGSLFVVVLNLINLSMVTEVAIVRAVGKPARIGEILRHALGNIIPIFLVSLAVALLCGLGLILLVIPCFYWMICTCVAVPARVGEPSLGISGSVMKSFELTRNHRWMLLLIWLVAFIAAAMIDSVFGLMRFGTDAGSLLPLQLADAALQGFINVLGNVFTAAIYVTLRESRDKLSPDNTASVFE
jgi:hypothetical protein